MADNIPITAGSGTNVATDDIGGVHHQLVKIEFGAADSATQVSVTNPLPVIGTAVGLGSLSAVPAGSTNGTAIGTPPAGAVGCRIYLPSGSSVTFTVAASAPVSAPTNVFTISQATTGPNWDENLSGQNLYITAIVGSPLFRWY